MFFPTNASKVDFSVSCWLKFSRKPWKMSFQTCFSQIKVQVTIYFWISKDWMRRNAFQHQNDFSTFKKLLTVLLIDLLQLETFFNHEKIILPFWILKEFFKRRHFLEIEYLFSFKRTSELSLKKSFAFQSCFSCAFPTDRALLSERNFGFSKDFVKVEILKN